MKEVDLLAAVAASGRYRTLRFLGRGAGSVVWEAETIPDGEKVALKILTEVQVGSPRWVSLRRELTLSCRLDHPHILRVRHFETERSLPPLIEMELAPGGSVGDLAAESGGWLSWERLKPLALQLCDALAHAHHAGIVHRDLKPPNLLLATDGALLLADFGCGCLLDHSSSETTSTSAAGYHGTLPFMSPQQLNGHPPHPSDDLYALGITLYTLLVGQPPFYRGYLVNQILKNPPPSIEDHQRQLQVTNPVPKAIQQTIRATLHKERGQRPASAAIVRELLASEKSPHPSRRRALILMASGGAALTGLTVLANSLSSSRPQSTAEPAPPLAEPLPPPTAPAATPVAEFPPTADREVLSMAVLPDGGVLAGGAFTRFGGLPRDGLVRLQADGSVDPSFVAEIGGIVRTILVLTDGRLLVGGDLWDSADQTRLFLALLDATGRHLRRDDLHCTATVLCLAMDAKGGVLIGGLFNQVGGYRRGRVARLDSNLELDADFNPDFDGNVHTLISLENGDLLAAGRFTSVNGKSAAYLAALNADGSGGRPFGPALNEEVGTMAIQPDRQILVGGKFTTVGGAPGTGLIRLAPDGSLDASFRPGLRATVHSIAVRSDGGMVVGGEFDDPQDNAREPTLRHRDRVASLAADGRFDETFRHAANAPVMALAFTPRNDLLMGGAFQKIADRKSPSFHYLASDIPADALETDENGHILWRRDPRSPWLGHVTFERSTDDGASWQTLGVPSPCPEGWKLIDAKVPRNARLRARGRTTSGIHNGSSGIIERQTRAGRS